MSSNEFLASAVLFCRKENDQPPYTNDFRTNKFHTVWPAFEVQLLSINRLNYSYSVDSVHVITNHRNRELCWSRWIGPVTSRTIGFSVRVVAGTFNRLKSLPISSGWIVYKFNLFKYESSRILHVNRMYETRAYVANRLITRPGNALIRITFYPA